MAVTDYFYNRLDLWRTVYGVLGDTSNCFDVLFQKTQEYLTKEVHCGQYRRYRYPVVDF